MKNDKTQYFIKDEKVWNFQLKEKFDFLTMLRLS